MPRGVGVVVQGGAPQVTHAHLRAFHSLEIVDRCELHATPVAHGASGDGAIVGIPASLCGRGFLLPGPTAVGGVADTAVANSSFSGLKPGGHISPGFDRLQFGAKVTGRRRCLAPQEPPAWAFASPGPDL